MLPLVALASGWFFGVGGAWLIPTSTDSTNGARARQDVAASLIVEHDWKTWFVELELFAGGFSASEPAFKGVSGRVGLLIGPPKAQLHLGVGGSLLSMSEHGFGECSDSECDLEFSAFGPAFNAEASLALARTPLAPLVIAPFVQLTLPTFAFFNEDNPAARAGRVPLLLLGVRLVI